MSKRRYGIQENNIATEFQDDCLLKKDHIKLFSSQLESAIEKKENNENIMQAVINIYIIHILFHIEFRTSLGLGFIYFAIIEGICLIGMFINLIKNIFQYKLEYINIRNTINALAILIGIGIFIIELIFPYTNTYLIFKLGSIYRFIPLLTFKNKYRIDKQKQRRFSVLPFRTNSERLINILRFLRTLDFISKDMTIDSQLEWAIRIICNQTLYNFEFISENKEQDELINWALSIRPSANHISQRISENSMIDLEGELPVEIKQSLKSVDKIGFNVFELKKASENNELTTICSYLLSKYDIFKAEGFNKDKFTSFIRIIQAGYYQNPYHNSTHAADVTQAYHVYIEDFNIKNIFNLTTFDIACCLISSSIHDFQHPGLNNSFLMNSSHDLAILYNDMSVLESHHVAASFAIIKDKNNNFLENLSSDVYRKYRSVIISIVLATDFAKHFKVISKLKLICKELDIEKNKEFMLKIFMHAADVSNSTRKWELYYNWAQLVLEEFFSQGDKEKALGIPISPLCDRSTVNFAKSQIGFIDLFIIPVFSILTEVCPRFNKALKNVQANRDKLNRMLEDEEDERKCVQDVLIVSKG
ncbi:hypothetical protein SteCoe_13396 [Stentor coeruleus]|uniref:Phosphodiesterase n=1 Tax=Stentor coeruleus TaxID=5963 RepID=A0A1R2C8G4_9CILI|nr:hypothetical protein SteCoe_13396 [Stentor coeruleus]